MKRPNPASLLFPLLLLVLGGCLSSSSGGSGSKTETFIVAEKLDSDTVNYSGLQYSYELYRLENELGGNTYVQWFPPPTNGSQPTIMLTQPYAGIDWSDEEVDQRWASRAGSSGSYCHDDEDQSLFDPQFEQTICYELAQPQDIGEQAFVYLFNGYGVLATYGRFYSGGSVEDDIYDMRAGLLFLAQQKRVDQERVGIFGGSWGGFEALYATANAPLQLSPSVGAAWYPVSDFEQMVEYGQQQLPLLVDAERYLEYEDWYRPYMNRLFDFIGVDDGSNPPSYEGLTGSYLSETINIPFLIAHHEWDTIIPIAHSQQLVSSNSLIEGLWSYRQNPINLQTLPIDHNADDELLSWYSFTSLFLLTHLSGETDTIAAPYDEIELRNFMLNLRVIQDNGYDISYIVPRLQDMADNRISLIDLSQSWVPQSGAAIVAGMINDYWGDKLDTQLGGQDVEQYLAGDNVFTYGL